MNNLEDNDTLTQRIIGCAIEVHRTLGPGLLESAYEQCMAHEMTLQDIAFRADNAAPRTTADVHEGVARGDRPADQFQRPAPHRRGEAISHLAFRAGIQDSVFLVHLFCLHPPERLRAGVTLRPAGAAARAETSLR